MKKGLTQKYNQILADPWKISMRIITLCNIRRDALW